MRYHLFSPIKTYVFSVERQIVLDLLAAGNSFEGIIKAYPINYGHNSVGVVGAHFKNMYAYVFWGSAPQADCLTIWGMLGCVAEYIDALVVKGACNPNGVVFHSPRLAQSAYLGKMIIQFIQP